MNKEESSSPTVATNSLFYTMIFDAKERQDVMTADVPNAFMQTKIDQQNREDKTVMKITGVLVDMLVEDSPDIHADYTVHEDNKKTLHVEALRATHGMLISALLFHMKFCEDLEEIGFEFNPHDACVANRMIEGKQHTV